MILKKLVYAVKNSNLVKTVLIFYFLLLAKKKLKIYNKYILYYGCCINIGIFYNWPKNEV